MTTDLDMLARHLINVWGDFVKVDDIPDELIVPFAVDTLRHAAADLAALRAENEVLKDRVNVLEIDGRNALGLLLALKEDDPYYFEQRNGDEFCERFSAALDGAK